LVFRYHLRANPAMFIEENYWQTMHRNGLGEIIADFWQWLLMDFFETE
jgi:hypothetical protein